MKTGRRVGTKPDFQVHTRTSRSRRFHSTRSKCLCTGGTSITTHSTHHEVHECMNARNSSLLLALSTQTNTHRYATHNPPLHTMRSMSVSLSAFKCTARDSSSRRSLGTCGASPETSQAARQAAMRARSAERAAGVAVVVRARQPGCVCVWGGVICGKVFLQLQGS